MNGATQCQTAKQDHLSQVILKFAADLSEGATSLAARVDDKLSPVCRQATPREESKRSNQEESYPQFFHEVNECLHRTRVALEDIEATISRCEV